MDTKKIEQMKIGGKILGEVLSQVVKAVKPGVTELELDALAEKLIRQKGAEPGFMKVPGYKHTICAATNDVVVHGIPKNRILKEGDIIGVDCGVYYRTYHTDMAETVRVLSNQSLAKNDEAEKFLRIGKEAMFAGIEQARAGNRIGHISKAIQDLVEGADYSVVRNLVGHGVGHELHEEPEIPGYLEKPIEKTPRLVEGMTIAIEVIYNMQGKEIYHSEEDGWTITTSDGALSGMFERTVCVTDDNALILTPGVGI